LSIFFIFYADAFSTLTTSHPFRVTNEPDMHVFEEWEEAGVPRENPHMHRENMQTHRKAAVRIQNPPGTLLL